MYLRRKLKIIGTVLAIAYLILFVVDKFVYDTHISSFILSVLIIIYFYSKETNTEQHARGWFSIGSLLFGVILGVCMTFWIVFLEFKHGKIALRKQCHHTSERLYYKSHKH